MEILGQTTLLNNIKSPIRKSEIKKTDTNNLRIILKGNINDADAKYLADLAKSYIKTRIVIGSEEIRSFDFLRFFPFLYGFQSYGIDNDRVPELNKLPPTILY
jgi:hypothetical protein